MLQLENWFSSSNGHDEVSAAKKAAKNTKYEPTIFSKIINKSIPADIIYEDDTVSYPQQ